MKETIQKALEALENADYPKFFELIDSIIDQTSPSFQSLYELYKGRFAFEGMTYDLMQQLQVFVRLLQNNPKQEIKGAYFSILQGRAAPDKNLPEDLQEELISDKVAWTESLKQALLNLEGIVVGNKAKDIFEHYGWLVETFLLKMMTQSGKENTLTRLSYMAEAYESSLRYLCYIQVAQLLHLDSNPENEVISEFLSMSEQQYLDFDYVNLLISSTQLLQAHSDKPFVKEITEFVEYLTDKEEDLYLTNLFLESRRDALLKGSIPEDDKLPQLLDEYLTALVYWLQELAFLAKYKLISIKDIQLNYRAGGERKFAHLYGELHGIYTSDAEAGDYQIINQVDSFTYNHSILLQKGNNAQEQFENYISLSPLLIDQSVFTETPKQTPEIYYFIAKKGSKRFRFAQYKNELEIANHKGANKTLTVKNINNNEPKLNELFKQMDNLFKPLTKN